MRANTPEFTSLLTSILEKLRHEYPELDVVWRVHGENSFIDFKFTSQVLNNNGDGIKQAFHKGLLMIKHSCDKFKNVEEL